MDSAAAAQEACEQALASTGSADLVLLYATIRHDFGALAVGARAAARGARVCGCSAQGVSVAGQSIESGLAVAAMAIRSDELQFTVDLRTGVGGDTARVAAEAARAATARGAPSATFCWWDPLTGVDGAALLRELGAAGPILVGGAAAQSWGPAVKTFQIADDRAVHDGLVTVSVHGGGALVDTSHGAEPIGVDFEVTCAEGTRLLEIDGKPALNVWRETAGKTQRVLHSDDVGAWLLGVREDGLPDHYGGIVTRVVFGFDEQSGAVQLMAPIAPGTRVQLCHRARGRVRDGAIEMAKRLRAALDGRPSLFALGFECGGRTGPFLGEEETRAECRDVLAELGDVPWLGMYAWGELAPVGGRLLLHQLTFPVLLFHA